MSVAINVARRIPSRVLILIPQSYFFYFNQGLGLRQAFARQGIDSLLLVDNMNDDSMLSILTAYKPEIIFSMNSFKHPVMERFPEILHIRWIQDFQFLDNDFRKETSHPLSNISYIAGIQMRERVRVHSPAKDFAGILHFAATPATSEPSDTDLSAFSVIAYIPPTTLMNARFEANKVRAFTGWDYLTFLDESLGNSIDFPLEQLDQLVEAFLQSQGATSKGAPEEVLRLFREPYIRASNRSRLVKKILSLGAGCRIYGTQEWTTWPEFAPYYLGPLPTTEGNYQVFRTTALNIHNGPGVFHPRVVECMAAFGGPILANRTPRDSDLNVESGTHYVEYDLSDFADVARELLANPTKRRQISRSAFEMISREHTWDHRVKQILSDIAEYC